MRVLFICTGNTCRSPMAAGYFEHLVDHNAMDDVEVLSAGTFAGDGEPPSLQSIQSIGKLGIDISKHKSMRLTNELLDTVDIIIAMTSSHKASIGSISASALAKTRLLGEFSNNAEEIADPFGGDADVYDECLRNMIPHLNALCYEIKKELKK